MLQSKKHPAEREQARESDDVRRAETRKDHRVKMIRLCVRTLPRASLSLSSLSLPLSLLGIREEVTESASGYVGRCLCKRMLVCVCIRAAVPSRARSYTALFV